MKIGIIGISGRMGKVLSEITPKDELIGGSRRATSDEELEEIVEKSDALIDFSTPAAALKAMSVAARQKTPVVTGTTGFSKEEFERTREFSQAIPILRASNFSLGVNLMAVLAKKCASVLPDFDFCIIDKHHRGKKDAPSGTALFLAEQASQKAQIVSLREGGVFGEHICDFAGENEELSICHRAFNRKIFADGALKCARWIVGKSPKLYSMQDYLEDMKCLG
ncbi:MAG: 4-hydroxy-tetrahydrodipicolinate reductase [Holosporaceae bacterium]|jgi:4-hydroxy-tetrahydrodipicolinate reductase|nr:4-hydroxy-tetrahydrodipicolinate reductase [Holosporaceae bacterium]